MGATACQRGEADHEEVQTGERNHVDGKLAEVRVQLAGEAQRNSDAGHNGRHQVVEVAVGGVGQLQSAHADVVQGLVVNAEGLIRVLDQLVNRQGSVVGLDDGVGDLRRWHDGEGSHHAVGELLADLRDEQSTHTSTGTTTQRVGDLEALKAVTALSLTTDDIQDLVDQLSTLGVVTLGPVVAGTGLAEDEVVGAEQLTEGSGANGVHGAGLEIDEDSAGNILVAGSLDKSALEIRLNGRRSFQDACAHERIFFLFLTYLVEVDVHALELELGGTVVAK